MLLCAKKLDQLRCSPGFGQALAGQASCQHISGYLIPGIVTSLEKDTLVEDHDTVLKDHRTVIRITRAQYWIDPSCLGLWLQSQGTAPEEPVADPFVKRSEVTCNFLCRELC